MGKKTKKCGLCGEEFPRTTEYFYPGRDTRNSTKTYLQSRCKGCTNKGPEEASDFLRERRLAAGSIFRAPKRVGSSAARVNDAIRKCLAREVDELNDLVEEHDRIELAESAKYFHVVWAQGESGEPLGLPSEFGEDEA